jgi:hypothetical protein
VLTSLGCQQPTAEPEGAAGQASAGAPSAWNKEDFLGTPKVLFQGDGVRLDARDELGLQGWFFILEDSVENDQPVEPSELQLTDFFSAFEGEDSPPGVSRFTEATKQPCISGTLAQVTTETGDACEPESPDCAWKMIWGGGIGISLSRVEGATESSGWSAKAWGVMGFRFETSGRLDGARVRFGAKDSKHSLEYCTDLFPGEQYVELTDLKPNCYQTEPKERPSALDTADLVELRWQLLPDTVRSHKIDSFCVEWVEALQL